MTETQTKNQITRIGASMIPVSDSDKAIEFYCETLGFELRADTPFGDGDRWVEVAPDGADTSIALVPPREGDPVGVDTRLGLATKDAEADHADLKAKGVDVDDEVSRMGGPVPPMFWFRDQDGNTLMVVEREDA
jgi:catechol 2,3-dioxygenase-like lactoylglutathione lyase family enzyme